MAIIQNLAFLNSQVSALQASMSATAGAKPIPSARFIPWVDEGDDGQSFKDAEEEKAFVLGGMATDLDKEA